MKFVSLSILTILSVTPALAKAEIEQACKFAAVKAAKALQEISYSYNGCDYKCDTTVKQISVIRTAASHGVDNNDIYETYDVLLSDGIGFNKNKYTVNTRSYDLGLCTFQKIQQIQQ